VQEPEGEFVTVAEAAVMLGVSDRTARRMAGQLADSDRTQDDGRGRRVRLSAMRSLRESASRTTKTPGQTPDSDRTADMADRTHGRTSSSGGRTVAGQERELIEQLKTENARLADALATAQRLTDQAQQLQLMTERRAKELEDENKKLKALPAMVQTAPSGASGDDSTDATAQSGASAPPAQREGILRGFLRRWW